MTTTETSPSAAGARERSELFADLSLGMRTPLGGVLGIAELLAATPLNAEQRELVRALECASRRLAETFDDLLELSHLEAGSATSAPPQEFHPYGLLRALVIAHRERVEAKQLQVVVEAHARDTVRLVQGDEGALERVLRNLLDNAIKFTDAGRVTLRLKAPEGQDALWTFEVEDTGMGIGDEDPERWFAPFVPGEAARERGLAGAGLGLAVARRLSERLDGRLEVRTAPNGGAAFRLVVPLADVEEAPHRLRANLTPPQESGGSFDLRVLVTEDNVVHATVTTKLLERLGCRVKVAVDGVQACELIHREPFDLVLMDCHMPRRNGFEATRIIRRDWSNEVSEIPIIALTADVSPDTLARCHASGMNDRLAKPVRTKELEAVLRRWSRRRT